LPESSPFFFLSFLALLDERHRDADPFPCSLPGRRIVSSFFSLPNEGLFPVQIIGRLFFSSSFVQCRYKPCPLASRGPPPPPGFFFSPRQVPFPSSLLFLEAARPNRPPVERRRHVSPPSFYSFVSILAFSFSAASGRPPQLSLSKRKNCSSLFFRASRTDPRRGNTRPSLQQVAEKATFFFSFPRPVGNRLALFPPSERESGFWIGDNGILPPPSFFFYAPLGPCSPPLPSGNEPPYPFLTDRVSPGCLSLPEKEIEDSFSL